MVGTYGGYERAQSDILALRMRATFGLWCALAVAMAACGGSTSAVGGKGGAGGGGGKGGTTGGGGGKGGATGVGGKGATGGVGGKGGATGVGGKGGAGGVGGASGGGGRDGGADVRTDATDARADARVDVVADAPGGDAGPMLVTLQFSGTVQTVAGTPLGLDSSARLAPVTGQFAYDLRIVDASPSDPQRGRYLHNGSSIFTFTVAGHTVTGSGLAKAVAAAVVAPAGVVAAAAALGVAPAAPEATLPKAARAAVPLGRPEPRPTAA